ncbi:hypothetical protein [Soonwooa sp.]|uniref:hypothetical protein n=1 Tax=Soonwooa sp. TaxID=1938592 RepID=UPI0028A5F966|nr:hypothetical protein [Soonwooa sp.]
MKEIKMPKFLLAEEPTAPLDRFTFIYSPPYLSLILIIAEDDVMGLLNNETRNKPRKTFQYFDESFEFVLVQNNIEAVNLETSIESFLDEAWNWYKDYLVWEDKNSDENEHSNLN